MEISERTEEFVMLVCEYLHLHVEAVKSKCRDHELCEARQLISYILQLHTGLSLHKIANQLNYVSHASPWRDKRQVTNFLEIDKKFAAKYLPLLLDAKDLAATLDNKEKVETYGKPPEPGDICWFWFNVTMDMPKIGTLLFIEERKSGKIFIAKEFFGNFDSCIYAGERVLPEKFRRCSFNNIIPESNGRKEIQVPELATC
jgi:hypothetical protein